MKIIKTEDFLKTIFEFRDNISFSDLFDLRYIFQKRNPNIIIEYSGVSLQYALKIHLQNVIIVENGLIKKEIGIEKN